MKLSTFLSFILFLLLAGTAYAQPSNNSHLDNKKGTSMRPILASSLPIIDKLEEDDMEIVRLEYDIITEKKTAFRQLSSQWEYGIIAFGDYRIADIDVAIYKEVDGQWTLIVEDETSSSSAAVTVKPSFDGFYRIDVTAYSFVEGYRAGRFGIIIFHE